LPSRPLELKKRTIIGMVHLAPLPGSPHWAGSLDEVTDRAARDASILAEEGIDALLVENYGDTPFYPVEVPPVTVAAMAVVISRIMEAVPAVLPWGVNVLRNDARAALSIAAAVGASFIRVNVHCGATATDQGLIEGRAHETLRLRASLAPGTAILADAQVKHGTPLRSAPLEEDVLDLVHRAHADAILITGSGTGRPAAVADLRAAAAAAGEIPVILASGATAENIKDFLPYCRGVIVGTAVKQDGRTEAAVDPDRVRAFLEAARKAPL
jgi:membrane complex biogenesis BtpA family protein